MALDRFFEKQLHEWTMARENHEALTHVWCRELATAKLPAPLRVQCNPARLVSTGAKMDKASIATRPCFLCSKNRPEEQQSLDLNDDFEWLVNPFPILQRHYTIAAKQHRPQRFLDAYDAMIEAVKALPEDYIVFYNGPKCGASAPDHLHLQAGISKGIPLIEYTRGLNPEHPLQAISPFGYLVYLIRDAENTDTFNQLYAQLPIPQDEYEPYMNVVAYQQNGQVFLLVIPRRAHRPYCYNADGEAKYLISPGALDMCGLIVTPRAEDYERLTASKAIDILCEVGVRTEPTIDVGIMQGKEITFSLNAPYTAYDKPYSIGEYTARLEKNKILFDNKLYDELSFVVSKDNHSTFSLHGVTIGKEFHWQQQETQTFQGSLILRIIEGELHAINRIAIEDYLTSVIASEMSGTSSVELLKAHAVISRSWLLAQLKEAPSTPPEGELTGIAENAAKVLDRYQTARPDTYQLLKELAKQHKQMPTEAERCLWEMLRSKNLGKKFRRQHIIGEFIVDFVCLEDQLVIEVDGAYHKNRQQNIEDKLRENILREYGYHLLRFSNEEVINDPDMVIEKIKAHMTALAESSPSGGVEGASFIKWYDREAHTHFDVCADDHCQRYQGVSRKVTPQVHEAIRATRGFVLSYEGEVCDARFSKCCGGKTELYESCWDDTPHPYLSVVDDPFCNTDDPKILSEVLNHYDQSTDFYRWTVKYTQKELSELVYRRSGFDYGDIIDLIPIERGPSGRIVRLQIVGTKATRIIGKELEIRRTLSETHLYSSAFEVEKKDNSFILHGSGWGHGVGLCQIGAAVMGAKGYNYKEILHHYYPEASLTEWYIDNNLQCSTEVTVST